MSPCYACSGRSLCPCIPHSFRCSCINCAARRDYCGHTTALVVFPKSLAKDLTVEDVERRLTEVLFDKEGARPSGQGERGKTSSPSSGRGAGPRVRIARWYHGIRTGRLSWLRPWKLVTRFAWRRKKNASEVNLVPLRPFTSLHDVVQFRPDLLVFPVEEEEVRFFSPAL